ncbi:MAG: single-stranded-DNA-specific exonuclease RecJ [Porphyromonas sp.]|nr:single-stranded-DNA-specific exonuclease RecJ [Porphyromonas sp.]
MGHEWDIRTSTPGEERLVRALVNKASLLPIVAKILVQRDVRTEDELRRFIQPTIDDLHDPFLMEDMEAAVRRLNRAIGNKEKILVYGDYDVDGITAVTLVYKYLRLITTNIDYYIPDRYDEGSGISNKAVEYAAGEGFSLVIALDCGIRELEMIDHAGSLGVDFIICDHHVPADTLPKSVANLNPKNPGSKYPFKELSGCGVGFKLMQAFAISNGSDTHALYNLLDLVAVSIAADLVPLLGENRTLAYFGLRKLNRNPSLGLRSIIDVSGLKSRQLEMTDISFKIGPRINAAGRVQSGRESVELLLSRNPKEAKLMSHHIDEYNTQRREIDHSITQEAGDIVESFTDMEDRKIIIVYDPSWHSGVIGIVASRLAEKYHRPTIVLTDTADNLVSGSARSVEGYDIHQVLEGQKDILENFGGHPFAAGLTLRKKHLHEFIQRATKQADEDLTIEDLTPKHYIDAVISLDEITPMLQRQLRRLAPYGPGHESPIFCTKGVVCVTPPRLVGYKKSHLKMTLSHPGKIPIFQAVGYNQSAHLPEIQDNTPFDILYTIEEYVRQGKRQVQLNVVDLQIQSPLK